MGLIILILFNWLFFKGSEQVEQAELLEAGDNVSSGDKTGTLLACLWIISTGALIPGLSQVHCSSSCSHCTATSLFCSS